MLSTLLNKPEKILKKLSSTTMSHNIVITSGEPAGIGPDICLSLVSQNMTDTPNTRLYIIADPELLSTRADQLKLSIKFQIHQDTNKLSSFYDRDKLNVIPVKLQADCQAGKLDSANSHYVLKMLDLACELCLKNKVDAIVTAPVQKSIINEAGFAFTGHTEYLAEKSSSTHSIKPVMMLATNTLRVALATTHLPLSAVSQAITKDSLSETIKILNSFLKHQAGIRQPKIVICGLNPHAGEDGNLGNEEINTITPVVEELKQQGLDLTGPLPADTLFTAKYLDNADAVLAMYHDQGLPVLKYSGFGKAVNITLGLPFIRTSVDHGTALDLAGTGNASNTSLIEAVNMAANLTCNNK